MCVIELCSTGTMGLVRNLDAHEIVHQVTMLLERTTVVSHPIPPRRARDRAPGVAGATLTPTLTLTLEIVHQVWLAQPEP